ncbi:MAG: SDR family NAD(P)-dependent oxidoreductase [Novosphingobium sp.]
MSEFRDRYGPVALVTGASSGIGRGFAEELAERGFDLVISARRKDRLDELAARLRQAHGVDVTVAVADLADPAAPDRLAEAARGRDVGLVVSNAGFSVRGYHETLNPDELTEMLTVDCHAPLHLAHRFLPGLKARGANGRGAGFVMVSSIEALMGCPFSAAYSAMKALVLHFGEALFAEAAAAESGVDILTTCPGATDTEAGVRAGIDMSKIPNLQDPRELAALTLDNLANGPTYFPNPAYKAQFDAMLAMPRAQALAAMAQGMKAAT